MIGDYVKDLCSPFKAPNHLPDDMFEIMPV